MEKPFNDRLKFIHTKGDGNCLYNAISIDLIGNETLCTILRYLVVYSLVSEYQYFGTLATKFDGESLHFFVRKAATNGEWGHDLHVQALSYVLKRPIYVFQKYNPSKSPSNCILYNSINSNDYP